MRKGWLLILLWLCSLTVTACTFSPAANESTGGGGSIPLQGQQSQIPPDTETVIVSRSHAFGKVNDAPFAIYTEPEEIQIFEEAFRTAEKMEGQLDVSVADYDIRFSPVQSHGSIHLWLDSQADFGMYTSVDDTSTGYRLTSKATDQLKELIWGTYYSPEQAMQNGDIVKLDEQIYNLDHWERFNSSLKSHTPDMVHLTSYTIEGGSIFMDLAYDGQTIKSVYDATHDAFGNRTKTVSYCTGLQSKSSSNGTEYRLTGCGDSKEDDPYFRFLVP